MARAKNTKSKAKTKASSSKARKPGARRAKSKKAGPKKADSKSENQHKADSDTWREIAGVLSLGFGILLIVATVGLQASSSPVMGPFGQAIATLAFGLIGMSTYIAAAILLYVAARLLLDKHPLLSLELGLGAALFGTAFGMLCHLLSTDTRVDGHSLGGVLGQNLAEIFRSALFTPGAILVGITVILVAIIIATPLRMTHVADILSICINYVWQGMRKAAIHTGHFCLEVWEAIIPDRNSESFDDELTADIDFDDPPIIAGGIAKGVMDGDTEKLDTKEMKRRIEELDEVKRESDKLRVTTAINEALDMAGDTPASKKKASKTKTTTKSEASKESTDATAQNGGAGPVIVESKYKDQKKKNPEQLNFLPLDKGQYKLPPVDLLHAEEAPEDDLNREEMLELSAKLTQTLEHYGVKGEVVAIRPGPVVTMYEFAPAPGTRLNKIVNLNDDLAMALEALSVRIVAPIPGKAAVGIEVPNKSRATVYLKDIIADKTFHNKKLNLPMALGKDIEGGPAVVDLAKMPHLLVAGTTGSGKSVSVNSMITSLLYSCTPDEVRMIMVDPKMLELSIYEGVPHLLLPVVTDPKKANLALRWGVDEMERRYDLLANAGVRDINSYNRKLEKELKNGVYDDFETGIDAETGKPKAKPTKLPYIVIVIDEFADLMMCAAKEVETSVARIAQKARAAGIHLILATQRPSVDVITGLIKANFPSRTAFRVTSKVDSRTILDQSGAESLLGSGDMLFSDRGTSPKRFHGCYVDEEEIFEVVEFLKTQGKPEYNLDIVKPRDDDDSGPGNSNREDVDEMYDKAVQIVTDTGQASISMVQRKLRVGYNRAARMIEQMEEDGIVSTPDHTNRREVLVSAAVA